MALAGRRCRAPQIPRHALIDLREPALHLRAGEILIAVVHRFELAQWQRLLSSAGPSVGKVRRTGRRPYESRARYLCGNRQSFCDPGQVVRRPAGCLGINPAEPKLHQIETINKDIDHANRIVLANPIFQAFRKKCALPAIYALNKALHPIPRKSRES
jgi:hypothetical protein